MRSKRVIEQMSGGGLLGAEGKSQVKVSYSIRVYQDFIDDVAGLKSIEGSVTGPGMGEMFNLLGDNIVLTMKDGRKLRGLLRDSNGSFVANGPVYS